MMKTVDLNGNSSITVSLRDFAAGTYFVSIMNNGIVIERHKIVKQ